MQRIRKDDEVVVTVGRDKGRRGRVLRVLHDGAKLVVGGVNVVKRHTKGNPGRASSGGILEKEMPLDASNVALWNPSTEKADRIGFRVLEDKRKVRYYKSNGEVVDVK
ncbi:MAG: 50S ribosomal protein L24 [Candidatus Eutrophobiaceae bacterium]